MTVKEYLSRPYHIVIQRVATDAGSYYLTTVSEFPGCSCRGDTYTEAFEKIQSEMEGWVESKLAEGVPIPEPINERQFSGRLGLRVPKSLHANLAMAAEREGISLNNYLLYKLSMYV
ncbi:MAG: type II toxin-antitoxin system HicB family antitoxin [Treponema sp.]|nr:type II toxin-antitoxin system HicB family antitoxin [Treponema sp.]